MNYYMIIMADPTPNPRFSSINESKLNVGKGGEARFYVHTSPSLYLCVLYLKRLSGPNEVQQKKLSTAWPKGTLALGTFLLFSKSTLVLFPNDALLLL